MSVPCVHALYSFLNSLIWVILLFSQQKPSHFSSFGVWFFFKVLLIEEHSYIVSLCIHCEILFVYWYYCVSFLEPFTSLNGCFPKDAFIKSKFLSFNIFHGDARWKSELALPSNLSFLWAGFNMPAGCVSCWDGRDGLLFPLRTFWSVHVVNSALVYFLITVCCQ